PQGRRGLARPGLAGGLDPGAGRPRPSRHGSHDARARDAGRLTMNALALYGRYVAASLRAQAQYPAATLMLTAGHCAATAIEILCVFALFHRFGSVGGWTFGEA